MPVLFLLQLTYYRGTLPPQLLLEILDSIQYLLFPFDVRSSKLPGRRINTYDFDPEATFYTFYSGPIRRVPDDFEYKYLGARVATLMRAVGKASPQSAPPQSGIGIIAWFERHASERNILTVALLCLFLTVFAGFLSVYLPDAPNHYYMIVYYGSHLTSRRFYT